MTLSSPKSPHPHRKTNTAARVTLKATLQRFNFSPKGGIEGLILADGDGFLQVTCSPEAAGPLLAELKIGKSVHLIAEPDGHAHGEHQVYKLLSCESRLRARAPEEGGYHSVKGKVVAINYAKHGEANGLILDSGDFLHLKPDGMDKIGLTVGDRVQASGSVRTHVLGGLAMEVEEINGERIGRRKPAH